ncbi:hypothetical protein LOD99_1601 [Oopsacas minuta]|uniref:Uncharacterized protein n=1 Tax=Oopsacas minuta TaxID=111878 RepID=A0AAV7K3M5_9METZ|nr:hypothetical protein LOD99_1601 [Oopsacas minuta]
MYNRDPLTEEMTPRKYQLPRSATHEHFSFSREYSPLKSDRPCPPLRPDRSQLRHRPHSLHVKPVYGVSGSTVCAVHEQAIPPRTMSPLSNRDLTCKLIPVISTRYSANFSKSEPAVGIIPVTYEWKSKFKPVETVTQPSDKAKESEIVVTPKIANLEHISNQNKKVHSMLLGILNKAGGNGIRQEKLPNLFSYLARTNRNPNTKDDKTLNSKKTSFEDTKLRNQLPIINK